MVAARPRPRETLVVATQQPGGLRREPCLSVVMPCYNEVDTLAGAIERVLQSPFPRDVIVVDDGSDDGSL